MKTWDHVLVGAGIIGLTTALELLRAGVPARDIAIVDPAPVSGASWVAGGMLAPVAEVQYGQEKLYPLMMRSAEMWPDLAAHVQSLTNLQLGYRQESTLVVAADRADATHLSELLEHQTHYGMEISAIPTRQARRIEPGLTPQLSGAVEIPGDHQVNPRLFCTAVLEALSQAGVAFVREKASELVMQSGRCTAVDLEQGERVGVGQSAYLCNGLGARDLEGAPRLPLRPVRGDLVRLAVPKRQQSPVDHVVRGFVEDRPIYVIPRTDGTIAVGATSREDNRQEPSADGVYTLLRDGIRIVPGLEECEFLEAIAGARPGTPDDLPLLGQFGANLVISNGYFRHGVLLAPLGAKAGAALGLSKQETTQPFVKAGALVSSGIQADTEVPAGTGVLAKAGHAVGVDLQACAWDRFEQEEEKK